MKKQIIKFRKKNTTDAGDVDKYIAALPDDSREVLANLRKTIRSLVPEATECISYRIPTFKYQGGLVAYASFSKHCSFFPMSYAVIKTYKDELKSYDISKGTIRFHVEKPLPKSLVRKMVNARIAENKARIRKSKSHKAKAKALAK